MNKKIFVYVAGKYVGKNFLTTLNNIRVGTTVCAELLRNGLIPFCPWLDYQFQLYEPHLKLKDYYNYSLSWLEKCDIVYVLPNYENSKGTIAEIKRAKELAIPVTYSDSGLDYFVKKFYGE